MFASMHHWPLQLALKIGEAIFVMVPAANSFALLDALYG